MNRKKSHLLVPIEYETGDDGDEFCFPCTYCVLSTGGISQCSLLGLRLFKGHRLLKCQNFELEHNKMVGEKAK
jgi:hypothetical protein